MITLILRSIIIYSIVLFAVRVMGKRQIGDMQPFELVATLIIADLACIPMSDVSIPIFYGLVPLLSLVVLHHVLTLLNRKSVLMRKVFNGRPIIVISGGSIDYLAMKSLNMTLNDLTEGLRCAGYFDIAQIEYAIVETNGNISVLPKMQACPVTNGDMHITADESALSIILVNDGKMLKDNLEYLSIDEGFVKRIMKSQNTKQIKDILILSASKNGDVFFQEKGKSSVTLKTKEIGK